MAIEKKIKIYPSTWPEKKLEVMPGDLSKFAPYGTGVYGYQANSLHPIKSDPPHEESGGLVYFGNGVSKKDFNALLRMMDVEKDDKDYAAFVQESENPVKDRYFRQMRIISKFGLQFMFNAIEDGEYDNFPEQKLTIGEAFLEFMKDEKKKYGTFFGDSRISGKMGGDGDYAQEELSFGFMLENNYNHVYRIWSRAWLVTK